MLVRIEIEIEKPREGDSLVMMIDGPDAEHLRGRAGPAITDRLPSGFPLSTSHDCLFSPHPP